MWLARCQMRIYRILQGAAQILDSRKASSSDMLRRIDVLSISTLHLARQSAGSKFGVLNGIEYRRIDINILNSERVAERPSACTNVSSLTIDDRT